MKKSCRYSKHRKFVGCVNLLSEEKFPRTNRAAQEGTKYNSPYSVHLLRTLRAKECYSDEKSIDGFAYHRFFLKRSCPRNDNCLDSFSRTTKACQGIWEIFFVRMMFAERFTWIFLEKNKKHKKNYVLFESGKIYCALVDLCPMHAQKWPVINSVILK